VRMPRKRSKERGEGQAGRKVAGIGIEARQVNRATGCRYECNAGTVADGLSTPEGDNINGSQLLVDSVWVDSISRAPAHQDRFGCRWVRKPAV
jgi:hypothetical protein